MRVIEIPKTTGTYADSLRVIGTADLLEEISDTQAIIKDMGPHFQIECLSAIVAEKLRPPKPGYYYIWRKSKEKEKPRGELVLDYEDEKRKASAIKKIGDKMKKEEVKNALAELGLEGAEKVSPEYRSAAILESMRKGWNADRDIYKWVLQDSDKTCKWIASELLNDKPLGAPFKISNSQFFNPASGKGVHAAKTQHKLPGPISNEVVDPFSEWMKYRGARNAMLPYRNNDDFKLFVIEPAEIGPKALAVLRNRLLSLNLWPGIRLDIEATLRLTKELIWHSDVVQKDTGIKLRGRRPSEIVKGLRQAFFKSMGTAAALMNDAFLPLPGWFRIENSADASAFLGIIEEHIGNYENGQHKQGCLGSLDEKHSSDVPILQQYRKWLTTGDMFELLDFFAKFALHIMERRSKKDWRIKEFSTENLTILFGRGYNMDEVVKNEGFLSVARAIRNCTIYAVSLGEREPHFGLAQHWKQKVKGGSKDFIPVLCDFVQTQNWEVEHRLKGKGHSIEKKDLDSVIGLIDKFGAELIGMLLLAYGYARAPRVGNDNIDSANKEGK